MLDKLHISPENVQSLKKFLDVIVWMHGPRRPWKMFEFECCLEKCLIFQSALKIVNFPGKVLEYDSLWPWKIRIPEKCIWHNWFVKNNGILHYLSSDPCFSWWQLGYRLYWSRRVVNNWNINSEYCNLVYGKLFHHKMTHLQYAR